MPDENALPDRVRQAMHSAGLTQTKLAAAIGLKPDKLSKCLHGKRRFSSLDLALIAEATSTTVDALLGIKTREIQLITICPTGRWACQFGECPDESHGWADDEDIEHAKATGQDWEAIASQSCGCWCTRGNSDAG